MDPSRLSELFCSLNSNQNQISGGLTNQVLTKKSNTNFDTFWSSSFTGTTSYLSESVNAPFINNEYDFLRIGLDAGLIGQQSNTIAIGTNAGYSNQQTDAIAIGHHF